MATTESGCRRGKMYMSWIPAARRCNFQAEAQFCPDGKWWINVSQRALAHAIQIMISDVGVCCSSASEAIKRSRCDEWWMKPRAHFIRIRSANPTPKPEAFIRDASGSGTWPTTLIRELYLAPVSTLCIKNLQGNALMKFSFSVQLMTLWNLHF